MKFILSDEARADLRAISIYTLNAFGVAQAEKYNELLAQGVDQIAANPKIGRIETDLSGKIRRFVCKQHIIYYRLETGFVLIIRVLNHRQSLSGQFE